MRVGLLRDWIEPDLLVLDDLFLARRIADVSAEFLQAIVHQRYKLRRAIVITSNGACRTGANTWGYGTMATTILDRLMHRRSHRRHARIVISNRRAIGEFDWP